MVDLKKKSFIQRVKELTKKYETNEMSLEEYKFEMAFLKGVYSKN